MLRGHFIFYQIPCFTYRRLCLVFFQVWLSSGCSMSLLCHFHDGRSKEMDKLVLSKTRLSSISRSVVDRLFWSLKNLLIRKIRKMSTIKLSMKLSEIMSISLFSCKCTRDFRYLSVYLKYTTKFWSEINQNSSYRRDGKILL